MKVELGPYPSINDLEKERVIKIEIEKFDTWNLDHTLALIILPCLQQFRKQDIGFPGELTMKKWNNILDRMIEAFDIIANEDGNYGVESNVNKIERGLKLFAKYYMHLWD
jgi:hypothetical protein